jgi:hypothetical protein
MIQKGHDALPFDDSHRTVARALCPLGYLVEPQAVLDCRAVDGNHEFSHGPHFRRKFVGAEFRRRELGDNLPCISTAHRHHLQGRDARGPRQAGGLVN